MGSNIYSMYESSNDPSDLGCSAVKYWRLHLLAKLQWPQLLHLEKEQASDTSYTRTWTCRPTSHVYKHVQTRKTHGQGQSTHSSRTSFFLHSLTIKDDPSHLVKASGWTWTWKNLEDP